MCSIVEGEIGGAGQCFLCFSYSHPLPPICFFPALQGKYDDAEPLYRRALAIQEKTLGGDHPDVAESLNHLAGLLRSQVTLICEIDIN